MDIIIGLATFQGREDGLRLMLDSIEAQTLRPTRVHVYDNAVEPDITDLGKFRHLERYAGSDCYFLSMDDDIVYPPTYVEDMVRAVDEHGCICTHHGSILKGIGLHYYWGHRKFRCMQAVDSAVEVDVAGTGVTGFRTSYFLPHELHKSRDMRMSDVLFSLEAARQGKRIMQLPHPEGYFLSIPTDMSTSCYGTQRNACSRQGALADEIYARRRGVWFEQL